MSLISTSCLTFLFVKSFLSSTRAMMDKSLSSPIFFTKFPKLAQVRRI